MKRYAIIEYDGPDEIGGVDSYNIGNYLNLPPDYRVIKSYPFGGSSLLIKGDFSSGFSLIGPFALEDTDRLMDLVKFCNYFTARLKTKDD